MSIKPLFYVITLLATATTGKAVHAQPPPPKIDSLCFHLYTDSLKKQVYNYISIDAKLSNGAWRPLSSKDVDFKSTYGKWDGNSLIIDTSFKGEYVDVTAALKQPPALTQSVRIYIKKKEEVSVLRSEAEILRDYRKKNR
jgi:hypothetical protein